MTIELTNTLHMIISEKKNQTKETETKEMIIGKKD